MPADEGPSLARTRTAPRSMMSRLRDDSQRTAAESTRAPRLALEQQQELEPKTLEQQLKDNEACGYEKGAMGILSQAIKGARLRKWEISRECFNLVCRALQIPCNDRCNGSFQGNKFILVLFVHKDRSVHKPHAMCASACFDSNICCHLSPSCNQQLGRRDYESRGSSATSAYARGIECR